ncbi:GNAT family N-acetyltransferase [Saccharibacillus kuerlensis]|uniref:GNAT family acetyltransferase n=1 Tax=Saccharibacillus kuerlensis TaxID=459527 RepID=A0ABQ2L8R0_9BACL|nr:GNAT family N-acetyltransferase [Saccharibacillus kuerlensis]GGO06909.1 GNAT family acetyltransferase [Saccharibacillus kuerlensis]
MEIKRLTDQDFDANIELAEYAFLYKLSAEQKEERRTRFADEPVWGVFENGELCAKLALLPLEVYIHGQQIKMGGIAGVSTWPEKRRQGMVSRLLRRALEEMKEQGQLLSYLHPFSVAFYRKYGWELFTENKNISIPVDKLPARKNVPGRVVREVRDIDVLKSIYDRAVVRYNGAMARSGSWWKNRIMNDISYTAVYYNEAGEAEAYVLYEIENRLWITEEIFWLNETARQGLWDFIINHDSKLKEVQLKLPVDDPMPLLLSNPMVKQEIEPYFMGRIVDAAEFIKAYPFAQIGSSSRFALRIEDRDAPWNEGTWIWTVSPEGEGKLEAVKQNDESNSEGIEQLGDQEISVPIGILTSMLLGYRRPSDLQRFGLLNTSEVLAEQLDALIPTRTPYLPDYF